MLTRISQQAGMREGRVGLNERNDATSVRAPRIQENVCFCLNKDLRGLKKPGLSFLPQ